MKEAILADIDHIKHLKHLTLEEKWLLVDALYEQYRQSVLLVLDFENMKAEIESKLSPIQ